MWQKATVGFLMPCVLGRAQPQDVAPRRMPDPWSLRGLLFIVSTRLWDRGLTPGTVVRTLGPMGPGLISKYARNRFREGMGLSDAEVAAFEEYF